jgi:GNAT superfamily N-acetyltransferase
MPRAYAAVVAARSESHSTDLADSLTEVQLERLNDPQYTAFVAMIDERPAGMASLFQIGQIGRVCDIFVLPSEREQGVATSLVRYAVRAARRWALHPICAEIAVGAQRSLSLLTRAGFAPGDTISEFVRPGTASWPV